MNKKVGDIVRKAPESTQALPVSVLMPLKIQIRGVDCASEGCHLPCQMLQCGSPECYPPAQGTLKMDESRHLVQALCLQQDRPSITDGPGKQREALGTQRWTLCHATAKKSLIGK